MFQKDKFQIVNFYGINFISKLLPSSLNKYLNKYFSNKIKKIMRGYNISKSTHKIDFVEEIQP